MGTAMQRHPLKRLRELRGWSQRRLAALLDPQPAVRTVSRWEQQKATPYPCYREQLCVIFGKDAQQLGFLSDGIETMQNGEGSGEVEVRHE